MVVIGWLVLATLLTGLAWRTITQTGLDYDEAVYGHFAKDFLMDRACAQHMPGSSQVELLGRPFPLFVQGYLGALKCWLLLPGFAVFGCTVTVMRLTMLAAGLVGLLCLMLWTRRTLGAAAAVLTGILVGLDPAFFFPTVCEWGAFVPSFLGRCAGLLALTLWWERRRPGWLALAGFALGLGFFNKIDFVVVLLALAIAAAATWPGPVWRSLRADWRQWLLGTGAFMLAAAPMLVSLVRWHRAVLEVQAGARVGEMATKGNTALSVLDGSYFHRLMEVGGVFSRMFESTPSGWSLYGIALGLAVVTVVVATGRSPRMRGWPFFCLVAMVVAMVGVVVLPDAVRIHHTLLVYPFPQLLIAAAATRWWGGPDRTSQPFRLARLLVVLVLAAVVTGHVAALVRTQQFIARTGGRGNWSTALTDFAAGLRTREDVMLVSLDWGFHEQLSFLTDAPQRFEPTWNLQEGKPVSLVPDPQFYYLIHPPEFSLFPYGEQYLQAARQADPNLNVQSFTNREGRVVFQIFRFAPVQ